LLQSLKISTLRTSAFGAQIPSLLVPAQRGAAASPADVLVFPMDAHLLLTFQFSLFGDPQRWEDFGEGHVLAVGVEDDLCEAWKLHACVFFPLVCANQFKTFCGTGKNTFLYFSI
jgi:hypothetical protein